MIIWINLSWTIMIMVCMPTKDHTYISNLVGIKGCQLLTLSNIWVLLTKEIQWGLSLEEGVAQPVGVLTSSVET